MQSYEQKPSLMADSISQDIVGPTQMGAPALVLSPFGIDFQTLSPKIS